MFYFRSSIAPFVAQADRAALSPGALWREALAGALAMR
jgi:hypothetical protein